MPNIDISGQAQWVANNIQTFNQFKTGMMVRKPVWDEIPDRNGEGTKLTKEKWIKAALNQGKDPGMKLAWDEYKFLHNNFFGKLDVFRVE